jgi:hypothetical protein
VSITRRFLEAYHLHTRLEKMWVMIRHKGKGVSVVWQARLFLLA